MKQTYRILAGAFLESDGTVKSAPETIELDSDVAALHASRIVLLSSKPVRLPDTPTSDEPGARPDLDRFR